MVQAPSKGALSKSRRVHLAVVVCAALILIVCMGWAVLVQHLVPDACNAPPANAQYLHCPAATP